MKTEMLTARLPKKVMDEITQEAGLRDTTRSALVVEALEKWLESR